MTIPWDLLMDCFSPSARARIDPHAWLWRSFHAGLLQTCVDDKCGDGVVTIPPDWSISAWADVTETERYGRVIAERLTATGVTVTGVPPDDPARRRFYHG